MFYLPTTQRECDLLNKVKPVNKDHNWEDQKVVSRHRWSLFRGEFVL